MHRALWIALSLLLLCACTPHEGGGGHTQAIVGAVLWDGAGGPPLSDSVVIVADGRIRAAGAHGSIAIPADADKIDGSGKYMVPEPIDVWSRAAPPAVTETQLESARESHTAAIAAATTPAETEALVNRGATAFVGMFRGGQEVDPELLGRMRNLKIVFAPALASAGADLEIDKRNTARMFRAGIPIAAASRGGDLYREADLLSEAGIPAGDVIVCLTQNGALALHELEQRGTIQAGKRADLLLLSANPGEDTRNLRRVAGRMRAGDWIRQ
ncbi:MAG TPA: hypothetical protein VGF59_32835 [Bryobacteraceae bacterium]|jgi:imidazolonepropionase-like amidohydrolase